MDRQGEDMATALRENIARLNQRRQREADDAPLGERLAHRITCFIGSMRFIVLHLVVYAIWLAANLGWLPGVARFDPTFNIIGTEASIEAIFLATFVLITQNRMAAAANRHAGLDLHINLLAEHELTHLAHLVERIARKLNIEVADPAFEESKREVRAEMVLDALDVDAIARTG